MTPSILIVGTGFAGLGMAIQLKEAGIHDFLILEAADEVGGTWRDNSYPGAACDVQSHLYSFSFEPNPDWSRMYAEQGEILAYLRRCADKYQLRPHIRFGRRVVGARWDEVAATWTLDTAAGEAFTARVVISGSGGLSRPAEPDLPGLSTFSGPVFHSARWRHDVDLAGKRVAVIGTGASSIQIVPSIVDRVAGLDVYQRSAPWILPKLDRAIGAREQALYRRFPALQQAHRAALYWQLEARALGFVTDRRILAFAERFAREHMKRQVKDPALRAKLTPTYSMGCKRILISDDYYPALGRPHVALQTGGIAEITTRGVRTRDGLERPADALVLATGFQAAEHAAPFPVAGRDGVDLNEHWRDGAEAYLGSTVHGYPNLFFIVGPNTGLGHSSMVFMIESQVAYVLDALRTMRAERLAALEVRSEVQRRFNNWVSRRHEDTVWSQGGCMSWYTTSTGKNTTLWPGFTWQFRLRTRRFDRQAYLATAETEVCRKSARLVGDRPQRRATV